MHTRRVFKPHFLENYAPPRESCCSCLVSGYVISSVSRFREILIAPEIDRHRSIKIINHGLINADLELRYSACLVKSCNNLRDKVLFLFRRRILEENGACVESIRSRWNVIQLPRRMFRFWLLGNWSLKATLVIKSQLPTTDWGINGIVF